LKRISSVVVACAAVALAITAIGAPAAAATPETKLQIVNGFPGKKVDVCVNGREIKSGLAYGKVVRKKTRTAKANVKFFARSPKTCKGTLLGRKAVKFDEAIVVLTKKTPRKVVVLSNETPAKTPTATVATGVTVWHAADLGPLERWFDPDTYIPFVGAEAGVYDKGDSMFGIVWVHDEASLPTLAVAVRRAGETDLLFDMKVLVPKVGWWTHEVLVGTNARNTRWVAIPTAF
jgi:hypothetical protein